MRCFVPFPLLQEKETISIFRFVYMKTCGKSKLKEKGEMNMSQKMPELIISTASKSITVKGPLPGVSNTFELVDYIPPGYRVWNIGENMADGYLPLCKLQATQPFPGAQFIESHTLKAIQCEGAQVILDAIGYGPETPDEMEKYIRKHQNAKPGSKYEIPVSAMKRALPLMRKLKWK